jgi:chromosome segregation ATPase
MIAVHAGVLCVVRTVFVEPAMYAAIGFLFAGLCALLAAPVIHRRAVRLTTRRLDAATPTAIMEIRADKDQLRAQFAVTLRQLETSVEKLKAKVAAHEAEAGRRTQAINLLKNVLEEQRADNARLQEQERALLERLGATDDTLKIAEGSLREMELAFAGKEQERSSLANAVASTSRQLEEFESEITLLRDEIAAARETESELRSQVTAVRRRNKLLADNLHSEIERLEIQLSDRERYAETDAPGRDFSEPAHFGPPRARARFRSQD